MLNVLSKLFYALAAISLLTLVLNGGDPLTVYTLALKVGAAVSLAFFGAVCSALDDIVFYLRAAHRRAVGTAEEAQ